MIRLTRNKVAVEPVFDPDTTKGGIFIPDIAKERCDQGIVKYTGPECKFLVPGDYVLFSGYTGTLVHLEGEGLLIIFPEEFAVCIIYPPGETVVPGVYLKSKSKEYFEATWESLTTLMADAIKNSDWQKRLKVKVPMPLPEDYEKWR